MTTIQQSKEALDSLIKKSRVHLYKPIQIAEILYRDRVIGDIDISDLETYRSASKKWRNIVSIDLVGNVSTSSARFQDDLFNANAIPVNVLEVLAQYNRDNNGSVEAYVYEHLRLKHIQLATALEYCTNAEKEDFELEKFIDLFWSQAGLKRSLDKIYEIIVYALFDLIVRELNIQIEVSFDPSKQDLLKNFTDFAQKVIGIDENNPQLKNLASINRVGVANAADRGLDMWANFGPAIQVKHLALSEELAAEIVSSVSSDRVVIVCKDAEQNLIISLLNQIGWKSKIQSIVVESELISWYEEALRGEFSDRLGEELLKSMAREIELEFPSVTAVLPFMEDRNYTTIQDDLFII